MSTDVCTAAIVSDQAVSRAGMEKLVGDHPALEVVASVSSAAELAGPYDLVVLDLPVFVRTTPDLIREVAQLGATLVCSSWEQQSTLLNAIRAGARGCITYHTPSGAITEAVRTVAQGGFYLCPALVGRFQAELSRPFDEDPNGLAPREIETLRWIAMGFTHAQIATRMGLSQATVNTYAKRIRAKLKVSNKAELTRMAIELGHLPRNHRAASTAAA